MRIEGLFIVLLAVGAVWWVFATFELLDILAFLFVALSLFGLGAVTVALLQARRRPNG